MNAWGSLEKGRYFSAGPLLFYFLNALWIGMGIWMLRSLRAHRSRPIAAAAGAAPQLHVECPAPGDRLVFRSLGDFEAVNVAVGPLVHSERRTISLHGGDPVVVGPPVERKIVVSRKDARDHIASLSVALRDRPALTSPEDTVDVSFQVGPSCFVQTFELTSRIDGGVSWMSRGVRAVSQ